MESKKNGQIYPQLRSYVCRDEISLLVLHVNINLIKIKALQYAIHTAYRQFKEEQMM